MTNVTTKSQSTLVDPYDFPIDSAASLQRRGWLDRYADWVVSRIDAVRVDSSPARDPIGIGAGLTNCVATQMVGLQWNADPSLKHDRRVATARHYHHPQQERRSSAHTACEGPTRGPETV
jgi:hypothetical protein